MSAAIQLDPRRISGEISPLVYSGEPLLRRFQQVSLANLALCRLHRAHGTVRRFILPQCAPSG